MNVTLERLLETNACLEEKVAELEGDKRHFQSKLEEYIRYDREEQGYQTPQHKETVTQLERRVSELLAEKADLWAQLLRKETEAGDPSQYLTLERNHRAYVMQQLTSLQTNSGLKQEQYTRQVGVLELENTRLKEEIQLLREEVGRSSERTLDWRAMGQDRTPLWELVHSNSYSSLPESLPSHSAACGTGLCRVPESGPRGAESVTGHCRGPESGGRERFQKAEIPSVASLRLTSHPSLPTADSNTAAELKKTKKQLEKYKSANIDLDQKLKDAKLELRKYAERRSTSDVGNRMDLERLRSDAKQLRLQLDRALSENSHLRSIVGRRY